jgi:uroporphyrinogen-III synthase
MAGAPRRPKVALVAGPGTLAAVDAGLRRAGVRVVRIASLEPRSVDPAPWLARLPGVRPPDTVVVTSRAAIEAGVRPWRRARGPFASSIEFWAVGPGTAQALRRAGIRRVHRPPAVSAAAILGALDRASPRTVVYLRSDIAGPRLARSLRARGHRVVDLVVYRLDAPPRLTAAVRDGLRSADLLVITSPSGLSNLRRQLGGSAFARIARTIPLVVLGERSRRAARGHGFRRTSVAPSTTAQRFTRFLLEELHHARA